MRIPPPASALPAPPRNDRFKNLQLRKPLSGPEIQDPRSPPFPAAALADRGNRGKGFLLHTSTRNQNFQPPDLPPDTWKILTLSPRWHAYPQIIPRLLIDPNLAAPGFPHHAVSLFHSPDSNRIRLPVDEIGGRANKGTGIISAGLIDNEFVSLFSRICGCPGGAIHLES